MIANHIKNILKTSLFAGSINFIALYIFMINADKKDFGIYLILSALFVLPSRLTEVINETIIRFGHQNKKDENQFTLLLFSSAIILYLALSVIIIFIICFASVFLKYGEEYSAYLIFTLFLMGFLNVIKNFLLSLHSSKLKFDFILKINFVGSIIFFSFIILIVNKFNSEVIYFLWLNIIISFFQIYFLKDFKINNFKFFNKKKFIYYYKKYFKKYSLPLFGNHIFSFFSKEHFSNLILGISFGPEILTNIALLRGVYDFIHNFIGKFLKKLQSIYHSINNKQKKFKYIRFILNFGNISYAVFAVLLYLFQDLFFSILKVEKSQLILLIFILITFEFISKFINLYYNNLILLGTKTFSTLISNFLKMVIVIIFIILGSIFQNIYVLLIGSGVGNLISSLFFYKYINYKFKFFENRIFLLISFTSYIVLFYIIFIN